MANNRIFKTVSGLCLQSPNFTVNFISNCISVSARETDAIMELILDSLEKFPTSVESTEKFLEDEFENHFNVKVSVKVQDRAFFCPPIGNTKTITLTFSNTHLLFHVKKKITMRSLKDISAEAVVNKLKTEGDINKLIGHIPLSLTDNLSNECRNDWNERYYRSNINCCNEHREGSLAYNQICPLEDFDLSIISTGNLNNNNKDFVKAYTTIVSVEQRLKYKMEFDEHYENYFKFHSILDRASKRFAELEAKLELQPRDSPLFKIVESQIVWEHAKNMQDADYLNARQQFQYLHEKLAHIKLLVRNYDTNAV